ncbi:hypothetical protein P9209_24965 [Prescottella defluvii]|nr:hypothetical protein P9209_24965 [Prescottella defluvii]
MSTAGYTPIHPDTARPAVRLADDTWKGLAADLDGRLHLPDSPDGRPSRRRGT